MQRNLIRWLHLSDFHVGKDGYAQRRIFARIHAHVRERVETEGAPDLVFITGDLAQSGKATEYKEFYDEFLTPLQFEALGDGWEGKVFTIPGNHDVDQSVAQYSDREKMCQPEAKMDVETAFECFEAAVRTLGELCDAGDPLTARCGLPDSFSFRGLRRLIDARNKH